MMANGGGDEEVKSEISKTLKQGERILEPTRRPDGTLRKPIRIRAGYVPQEEVALYQSKGALWKKEMSSQAGPPGFDDTTPVVDTKPKTKSVKRNERKKEKRLQAALEKDKPIEELETGDTKEEQKSSQSVKSLTSQMNELGVSSDPTPETDDSNPGGSSQDIDKRIRALKKKIRLAEGQQQKTNQQDSKPEQLEKLTKLEGWRKELKLMEDKKNAS